ncbi:MAG: hypothetical protein PWP76_655 [Candidatus Diapherotrites archaeon]|nr:hypothetical protein [Candidatus Diapherotrites archaeon]MDN5367018.1 hypothetical protein [Candidatus Diapherotrites archaeon]
MIYDPFEEIRRLHEYIDRMFSDMFTRMREPEISFTRAPLVDVVDEGDKFRIVAEIPGVNKEDLDVRIMEDSVVIRAEKKMDKEDKGKNYYVRERGYTSYYRTIALPEPVVPEKAEATYKNGVLEIVVPKRAPKEEEGKGFRVQIK